MTDNPIATITNQETPQLVKDLLSSWLVVLFFIFSSLLSREVSIIDSLSLCLFVTIDVVSGALFWILVSNKKKFNIFELFGVGIALGTAMCTIVQQLLRDSIFEKVSPFLFIALTLIVFNKKHKNDPPIHEIQFASVKSVFLICTIISVALSSENYVNWIVVFLLTFSFLVPISKKNSHGKRGVELGIILFFISIAFIARKSLETFLFGFSDTTRRVSNFDQVFFEANSRGLENYGPFDNIFLSNTKFAYYWFSDAWSGAFSAKTGAHEWVVTTEFGILIAAFGVFFLAKAVCINRQISSKQSFVALILLATASLQGNANFAFSSQSFSLFISVLWMSLIIFLINENALDPKLSHLIILMFSIWILVLTKTVTSIPFLLGIGVLFLISLAKKKIFESLIYLMTITGSLLTYFIFIKPEDSFQGSYSEIVLKPTRTIFDFYTISPLLDFSLFIIFEISGLLWLFSHRKMTIDHFLIFSISILIFSFTCSFLISFQTNSSGNQYLIIPLLLITPFLISEGFSKLIKSQLSSRKVIFAIMIGICAGFYSTSRLHYFREKNDLLPLRVTELRLIPLFVMIIFGCLILIQNLFKKQKNRVLHYCIMVLVASAPGSYVAHSIKPLQQVILSKDYWERKDNSVQIKMIQIEPSMNFATSLATSSDVIASNALDDFGLIAAMTGVRNFASTYTRQLWGNTETRYETQSAFGENPNLKSYEFLRNGCVTLFFFDKSVSQLNRATLEPYAAIKYEDNFGAVLQLKNLAQLPKNC